jgi:hypothetical protein
VGAGIAVNITGLTISGLDAANYNFTTSASTTANIVQKALSATDITANNKVYDGATIATLNTASAALTGKIIGDNLMLVTTNVSGAFDNKNAGTGKSVTVSGLTIVGDDAGNYSFIQPTGITAAITQKQLTVIDVTAFNKIYDGNTTAILNTNSAALAGIVGQDAVTLNKTSAVGAFASADIGTGITVNISGLTIQGIGASNYSFTQPTTTANIISVGIAIWTGSISTNWNTPGNWNTGMVPAPTSDVVIASAPNQPMLSTSTQLADLTINFGATLTISGSPTFTVTGDWTNNGTFTAGIGTVAFDGTTTINGSSTTSFNNVAINSGKSLTGPASGMINVAGNWANSGTFAHNSSTVVFNGTGSQYITTGISSPFYGLIINKSAHSAVLQDTLDVNGNFRLQAGTFNINAKNQNYCGNFQLDSGTTYMKGGTLTFDGTGGIIDNNTTKQGLGDIVVGGASKTRTLGSDIRASSITINETDTLDFNSSGNYSITVSGDWTNSGTFFTYSGVVILAGSGAQHVTTGGCAFNVLVVKNTNAMTEFNENTDFLDPPVTDSVVFSDALITTQLILTSAQESQYYVTPGLRKFSFAAGVTHTITDLSISSSLTHPLILKSATNGTRWILDTETTAVNFVAVKDCENAGSIIDASYSINAGNNIGWKFLNFTITSGDIGDADNYSNGQLPGLNDEVIVIGNVTISADIEVGKITVVAGRQLDLSGCDITVNDALINEGVMVFLGNENIYGTITNEAGSTVKYTGTEDYTSLSGGSTYSNLEFNGSGTYRPQGDITVAGEFKVSSGTFIGTVIDEVGNLKPAKISVTGDFRVETGSTFDAGLSTVTFTGAGTSCIYGTTFNNLTIDTPGKIVIIDAGRTELITGTFTAIGTKDSPIIFMSNDTGNKQWNIDLQGTANLSYVEFRDTNNIGTKGLSGADIINGINNTNLLGATSGASTTANNALIIPGENVLYRDQFTPQFSQEPVEVAPYITMMPVAVGPMVAMVPVSTPVAKIAAPGKLDTVVAGQQLIPGITPAASFTRINLKEMMPVTIAPDTFMDIKGMLSMPAGVAFVEVKASMYMPAIAAVGTFRNAEVITYLPVGANFMGAKVIYFDEKIIPPGTFDRVIMSVKLPASAKFMGMAASLSTQRIIRPGAFDGAQVKFIQQ